MLAPPPLPRTLEAALRDLDSARPQMRASAIGDLVRHALLSDSVRERALPRLGAALKDDAAPAVRAAAAVALGDLHASEALAALLVAIEDVDAFVRQMSLNALGEIGDARAATRLGRALADARPEVRYQAIIAFSKLAPSDEAEAAVAHALEDADDAVRYIALRIAEERLEANGRLSDRVTDAARRMIEDGSSHVALAAALLTAKSGGAGAEAARSLLEGVIRDGRVDGAPIEKEDEREAVEMAGRIDLRGAIPALERRVWGLASFVRDTCAWQAKIALARMGHARARAEILRDLSSPRSETRAAAIVAVGRARFVDARATIERLRGKHAVIVDEALTLLRG